MLHGTVKVLTSSLLLPTAAALLCRFLHHMEYVEEEKNTAYVKSCNVKKRQKHIDSDYISNEQNLLSFLMKISLNLKSFSL